MLVLGCLVQAALGRSLLVRESREPCLPALLPALPELSWGVGLRDLLRPKQESGG